MHGERAHTLAFIPLFQLLSADRCARRPLPLVHELQGTRAWQWWTSQPSGVGHVSRKQQHKGAGEGRDIAFASAALHGVRAWQWWTSQPNGGGHARVQVAAGGQG